MKTLFGLLCACFLFLFPGSLMAQLRPGELWHGKYVSNLVSGDIDRNLQAFLSWENDTIVHFIFFREFLDRETGKMVLSPWRDSLRWQYQKPSGNDLLRYSNGEVAFTVESQTDTGLLLLADQSTALKFERLAETPQNYRSFPLQHPL